MKATQPIIFTVVVLTFNRKEVLGNLLGELSRINRPDTEFVVVDNGSRDGTEDMVMARYPSFQLVKLTENIGAVGRNRGIAVARGKYVVTLDDDIFGIDHDALDHLQAMFSSSPTIGAICFKVVDYYFGGGCNWCHPNKPEELEDISFETTEITEGAVAFRNEMLKKTGLYTEELFISHEGADLAARILNKGYEIHYTPLICVRHKYSREARDNWRRYYYDSRNDFWLVIRNYRFVFAISHLLRRLPTTFVYSARDGYVYYWVKAVKDALLELPEMLRQRHPVSLEAHRKMRYLNRTRPGLFYYFRKRFFCKQVRI
ncbi:MAG: glycosyltransferase family 2 protein [Deltaproteobacteria bacterium]|nr:glycosyltransferase family 2 protein [Deltaproteobacteria bacterium]